MRSYDAAELAIIIPIAIFVICAMVSLNAWIITLLWAWLIPVLVPGGQIATSITFWQAIGVTVFSAFLFPGRWVPSKLKSKSKD